MKLTLQKLPPLSLFVIFCFLSILFSGDVKAAGVVINTNDSGAGSLRAAMVGGGTVTFNIPSGSPGCTGTVCNIALASSLTFDPGVTTTIDATLNNTITITGGAGFRVFNSPNTGSRNANLIRLTITGGNAAQGGGIGFFSGGTLNITDCTVRNNNATGANGQGGGLFLANSGATNNTITGSTFSNNTANGSNGQGGGIWTAVGLSITNSTISANSSNGNNGLGGGLYVLNSGPTVTINYATFTLNTSNGNGSNGGGGIYTPAFNGGISLRNTIVAQNTTTGTGPDANGNSFVSNGNNLIGISAGNNFVNNPAGNGDQVGTSAAPLDPLLGPLANNSGPTQTHALLANSPAIDKGKSATAGVPATDQRGLTRPVDNAAIPPAANGGDNSDIGAFEVQASTAAGADITGRVTNAFGSGINGVTLSISGGTLTAPIYVRTSSFGYYSFAEMPVGEVYIVTVVSAKQHGFSNPTRIINLNDNVSDADFVADQP